MTPEALCNLATKRLGSNTSKRAKHRKSKLNKQAQSKLYSALNRIKNTTGTGINKLDKSIIKNPTPWSIGTIAGGMAVDPNTSPFYSLDRDKGKSYPQKLNDNSLSVLFNLMNYWGPSRYKHVRDSGGSVGNALLQGTVAGMGDNVGGMSMNSLMHQWRDSIAQSNQTNKALINSAQNIDKSTAAQQQAAQAQQQAATEQTLAEKLRQQTFTGTTKATNTFNAATDWIGKHKSPLLYGGASLAGITGLLATLSLINQAKGLKSKPRSSSNRGSGSKVNVTGASSGNVGDINIVKVPDNVISGLKDLGIRVSGDGVLTPNDAQRALKSINGLKRRLTKIKNLDPQALKKLDELSKYLQQAA